MYLVLWWPLSQISMAPTKSSMNSDAEDWMNLGMTVVHRNLPSDRQPLEDSNYYWCCYNPATSILKYFKLNLIYPKITGPTFDRAAGPQIRRPRLWPSASFRSLEDRSTERPGGSWPPPSRSARGPVEQSFAVVLREGSW